MEELANNWNLSIEATAYNLGDEEIMNRIQYYPQVSSTLTTIPFDLQQFAVVIRKCWVMGGYYDGMRFNQFVKNGSQAVTVIYQLIDNFPLNDRDAANRIDAFINSAVTLGFHTPSGSADMAAAAQLASVILTSLYPSRFVDYRRTRWKDFAEKFDYKQPMSKATYGERIIWAGQFVKDISETETYRKFWLAGARPKSNPFWVISGICWFHRSPTKLPPEPFDYSTETYPEGAQKRRLHLMRERNRVLVAKVKKLGLARDPKLRCEVCGFSFIEIYGEHGKGFIEAHHKEPLSKLTEQSRTRIEDIALVCANCHRMIHTGDKTLTLEELKAQLQNKGTDAD